MANLQVKDGAEATKYLKATGAGTVGDPHVVEHLDSNSAAILTAVQAIQTAVEILDNVVSGSEAQVDIVSSTLPTGAATAANQATANTALSAIQAAVEILDNIVSGTEAQVDVVTVPADPFGADADVAATAGGAGSMQAKLRLITSQLDSIQTAVELLDNAISGSEMQVDLVGGNLPDTAAGDLAAIKTAIEILDNIVSGSEAQVDVVGALPAGDNNIGKVSIDPDDFNAVGSHGEDATISVATTLTKEVGATRIMMQAIDQNIRFRLDGANPDADTGFQLAAGDIIVIPVPGADVRVIEETATATVQYQWLG